MKKQKKAKQNNPKTKEPGSIAVVLLFSFGSILNVR